MLGKEGNSASCSSSRLILSSTLLGEANEKAILPDIEQAGGILKLYAWGKVEGEGTFDLVLAVSTRKSTTSEPANAAAGLREKTNKPSRS